MDKILIVILSLWIILITIMSINQLIETEALHKEIRSIRVYSQEIQKEVDRNKRLIDQNISLFTKGDWK